MCWLSPTSLSCLIAGCSPTTCPCLCPSPAGTMDPHSKHASEWGAPSPAGSQDVLLLIKHIPQICVLRACGRLQCLVQSVAAASILPHLWSSWIGRGFWNRQEVALFVNSNVCNGWYASEIKGYACNFLGPLQAESWKVIPYKFVVFWKLEPKMASPDVTRQIPAEENKWKKIPQIFVLFPWLP